MGREIQLKYLQPFYIGEHHPKFATHAGQPDLFLVVKDRNGRVETTHELSLRIPARDFQEITGIALKPKSRPRTLIHPLTSDALERLLTHRGRYRLDRQ